MENQISRKDYMSGNVTFAEYYRAICLTAGLSLVGNPMLADVETALEAGDEHLNTIPLAKWDAMAGGNSSRLAAAFKHHGDFWSLAGGVCAYKQAARDAAEHNRQVRKQATA